MCILSTDAYVMYISFLLLVTLHMSYHVHLHSYLQHMDLHVHIIQWSFAYMSFLTCTHANVMLCVISSTLYISYHVQLSFCTLSPQMHIVHVICILSAHVHIICLSSLTLLVYPIIHNLVSAHCLHTCTLSMSSACCLHMYTSFACHL